MDHNNLIFSTLIVILCAFAFTPAFSLGQPTESPIGYWKTIDDVTGKPKSIVQIWATEENILMGKIVKVFSKNEDVKKTLCTKCKGERHNQPIVGMVVVSGLKAKEKNWTSGEILDPENGKTYNCAVRSLEKGKKLQVRGYFGLPMLGRSQTWERVDLMSG
jgi:uncharacterized protein (DUF2147 family)